MCEQNELLTEREEMPRFIVYDSTKWKNENEKKQNKNNCAKVVGICFTQIT